MPQPFSIQCRVYYEDTDAAGVVYYANYLRFIERCRSEWLISIGHSIDSIAHTCGAIFVVRALNANYRLPAKLMDQLSVSMQTKSVGRAQFSVTQKISRGTELLFEAEVALACVDPHTFRPKSIPTLLKNILVA